MRKIVAALLVAVAAGCGGSSPAAWVGAQLCLADSGTVIDHGRPPALPFLSPYDPNLGRMPAPASFERDVEVSFGSPSTGANDVRLFFFDGKDSAARSEHRIRTKSRRRYRFMRRGIAYVPGAVLDRSGAVLVLWSSAPSAGQRSALVGCVA